MNLRELQDSYFNEVRAVTEEKLEIGSLIRTIISVDEGLVLKGRREKPKRLVIVGVDKDTKTCFGSVLVNTKMNPKAHYTDSYLKAQYLLEKQIILNSSNMTAMWIVENCLPFRCPNC